MYPGLTWDTAMIPIEDMVEELWSYVLKNLVQSDRCGCISESPRRLIVSTNGGRRRSHRWSGKDGTIIHIPADV